MDKENNEKIQKTASSSEWIEVLRSIPIALHVGWVMVGTIGAGVLIGYFADRWLGTGPWLTITLMILGVGGGFFNVYQLLRRMIEGNDTPVPPEAIKRAKRGWDDDIW